MGKESQKDIDALEPLEEIQADSIEIDTDPVAVEVDETPDPGVQTPGAENDDPGEPVATETPADQEKASAQEGNDGFEEETAGPEKKIVIDSDGDGEDGDEKEFAGLDDEDISDIAALEDESDEPLSEDPPPDANAESSADGQKPSKNQKQTAKGKKQGDEADPGLNATGESAAPAKGKPRLNYIIAGVLGALTVAGYLLYSRPFISGVLRPKAPAASMAPAAPGVAVKSTKPVPQPMLSDKEQKLRASIDAATRLRNELLAKKEQIYQLKLHYRHGVAELKQWVANKVEKQRIASYGQAVADKQIELKLRTIQRRQAYIVDLEKPYRWIEYGSERLLFLIRSARFDLLLFDVAGGIDLERHRRHLDAALQKYQPTAKKLAVDPPEDDRLSLKPIWNQVIRFKAGAEAGPTDAQNLEITEEICSGRYQRHSQLSAVSVRAARCLSRMRGTALVLNDVSQLSAAAAQYLFKWRGDWICLNGLTTLSPEVARTLFQWPGEWISLNGLSEFTPQLAQYLLKWNGEQLELMGLKPDQSPAGQKVFKYLALWETSGGKLFVPDAVRREMERGLE